MLLESAITLPIFVVLIFFLIQMTLVWIAKEMTAYAAYCGARAALVYNPADYAPSSDYGVVKFAAMTALSWVSWSLDGDGSRNFKVGQTDVPLSSDIRRQVHVSVDEYWPLVRSNEVATASVPIEARFPGVRVTVAFDCSLFIPLGDMIVAYFFGARENDISTEGAIGVQGFAATNGDLVEDALRPYCPVPGRDNPYVIRLTESCTLAKPWRTETFPVMPASDRAILQNGVPGVRY